MFVGTYFFEYVSINFIKLLVLCQFRGDILNKPIPAKDRQPEKVF